MESLETQVTEIQVLYPRIYMACHTEHTKARSSEVQLSARDSSILAHLSVKELSRPGPLAKHLDVAQSTLSEALHNLVSLGYVSSKTDPNDERRTEFKLTAKGIAAMKTASVLDSQKVAAVMDRLTPEQRLSAIEGLRLLADAALGSDR
jgi:DNA-binding MarR family transcriptional regulator